MTVKRLQVLYALGVAFYFIEAIWSLFIEHDKAAFMTDFQTGLLFLILATVSGAVSRQ